MGMLPGGKAEKKLFFHPMADNLAQIDPDLSKEVDVGTALRRLADLNPELPDAVHDWLIVGWSLTKCAREYGLSRNTLRRGREFLKEALRDYA
jgi:hypothetical protein